MSLGEAAGHGPRVFLSYSRKDGEFISALAAALQARGYPAPIFDQSEHPHDDPDLQLTAQDEWWLQLKTMIAAADVMVFVVSPDSAASRVCDDEIAHAKNLGKRVIGIERRPINFDTMPERLRALNVKLRFSTDHGAGFDDAFSALCAELDTNVDWRRRGSHWTRLAERWAADGRAESKVLPPGEIEDADRWAASRPITEPEPGPLVLDFLEASRRSAGENRERLLTITGRAYVKPAEQALAEGRFDAALRLAAAGIVLGEDENMRLVPERSSALSMAADAQPLRAVFRGQQGPLSFVAFSPDGTRIVTASFDGGARVWNAASGAEILVLRGHEDAVRKAQYIAGGARIVTLSAQDARIWDALGGQHLHTLASSGGDKTEHGALECLELNADGVLAAIGYKRGLVEVWDLNRGSMVLSLPGHTGGVAAAHFSPNGKLLATASHDETARLWDLAKGRQVGVLKGHRLSVHSVRFSPDGARVLTAGEDSGARLWKVASRREILSLVGHKGSIRCVRFSPDGRMIATASFDRTVRLWDAETGRQITVLPVETGLGDGVEFSPDGSRILTSAAQDQDVRMWDARSGAEVRAFRGHGHYVRCAAFSPDGSRLITASMDGSARIWDASLGRAIAVLDARQNSVADVTINADASRFLTASDDKLGRLWDAASGQETVVLRGHSKRLRCVAFSNDSARIVTGSDDQSARIWNAATGECVAVLAGHADVVECTTFSPDQTRVLTSSRDWSARLWDANSGKLIATLKGDERRQFTDAGFRRTTALFSPNGSLVVTVPLLETAGVWEAVSGHAVSVLRGPAATLHGASWDSQGARIVTASDKDKVARLWDARSGIEVAALGSHESGIAGALFSPDDASVLTFSGKVAWIWDTAGNEVASFVGHASAIACASFSPDGRLVVTGAHDDTARVWDAATGRQIAVLRGHHLPVVKASFSANGSFIATCTQGGPALIWDARRLFALCGDPVEVLAASLTSGRGFRTLEERSDVLMQLAPDDLYSALVARLTPTQRESVATRAELLGLPFHPSCYRTYCPPSARS